MILLKNKHHCWREKHEKSGAIEGEKEGARYVMQERENNFGVFFSRPLVFQDSKKHCPLVSLEHDHNTIVITK